MHILIIGAAGMVGRKLADRLAKEGQLGGQAITKATLHDVVEPSAPAGAKFSSTLMASDFSLPGEAAKLVAGRPDVIFHLAAIVSGEAEQNFDLGYRINLHGTMELFAAIRAVGDGYRPLTSYGTQKAIGELLLSDYSRKGFFDGIAIRLPTICVRPGKPNKAASGFFSNIIREPLAGHEAVLPVSESVRHWHASPRSAVGFLVHAATLDLNLVGPRRALAMPGLSVTVGEQIEALRKVAGDKVVARIRREPDPAIIKIVDGWATRLDAKRATALGFKAETSFEEIIRVHIEDELGGKIA